MDKLITMDDTAYKSLIAEKGALHDLLTKLNIDPRLSPQMRAKFIDKVCMELDGFKLIAELVGLEYCDPDAVRRGVKDVVSDRDAAQAHAKELEGKLEALKRERHDETLRSGEHVRELTRRCADLEAKLEALQRACPPVLHLDPASAAFVAAELGKLSSAGIKMDPARDYNAEIVAARIDALKTLGVNPYDPPVCVVGAAKRRAKTLEHAEELEADVAAVWELWGAGREREPGKLHELCQEQERASAALESKLRVITEKLDAAKVPTHYGREQKGGPIALPERMDLLIQSHDCARALVDAWEVGSMRETEERVDAAAVLDELGAPDHAGSIHLSIAARIRALPGLLRP